jgi:large subunit ribosomal protein L25
MSRSKTLTIEVKPRVNLGTSASRRERGAGIVPAVLYGHGAAVQTLTVAEATAREVLHHPGLMSLSIDGVESATAILKASQRHPVSDLILHLDFLAVRADELIRSTVPVDFHGVPMGAARGGQLEQIMHLLEIECLPGDLPESIDVDVSGMDLDTTMHVRDMVMPEGIRAVSDAGLAAFQVRLPKVEEVKEEAPAEAAAAEGAAAAAAEGGAAAEGDKAEKKVEKKADKK